MEHQRELARKPEGEERSVTDACEQKGRAGTGSQQGWCGNSSIHGKTEYQSTGGMGGCELVMETKAEGKQQYVSRAGMSFSSLDELPGSCPLVPLVFWQGGNREAAAQEILVSRRGSY